MSDWLADLRRIHEDMLKRQDNEDAAAIMFAIVEIEASRARDVGRNGGWRDISTAPKDGSDVLLHFDGRQPVVAAWFRGGWAPMDLGGNHLTCGEPTYWQPVPASPECGRGCGLNDSNPKIAQAPQ